MRWYKGKLASKFDMKGIGLMHYFMGLEVWQGTSEVFLGQGKYTIEILKRFHIMDCNPLTTPMLLNMKLTVELNSDLVDLWCTSG
jgi:hypothetical protein